MYRKDPKFSDRSSWQTVKTNISLLLRNLIRVYTAALPSTLLQNHNNRLIIVGQGPAVLATTGTG